MHIRNLTIADYEEVYALWISCKGMGLNDLDDTREGITRYLDRNPSTCFVAIEESSIVGVIIAGHDGRRGFIYHTAVHPQFRRRGIASTLVASAMDALGECGIHKVALVVFQHNSEGNAFWERAGFVQREDLTYRNKAISQMQRIDT